MWKEFLALSKIENLPIRKRKEQNKLEHTRRRHKAINLFLKEITLQLKSLCKVKKIK